MSRAFFKFSLGFLLLAAMLLAASLFASAYYLDEQARLATAGDTAGAVEATRTAERLDPFSPEPPQTRALLLQQTGRNEEAVDALGEAISRDPNNYAPHLFLGNLQLFSMNELGPAVGSYREALRLNPNATVARLALGEALVRANELEEAGQAYEVLREEGQITPQGLYDLGRIYVRTGEPGRGARTIEAATRQIERTLGDLGGSQREQTLTLLQSMRLARADALVVQRRYVEAAEIVAASEADQAPAILQLLNTDPETYRDRVINSEIY